MKKLLSVLLVLFIASCSIDQYDETSESDNSETLSETNQDIIQILVDKGYKRSSITELDEYFLVAGDILFSKNIEDYVNEDNISKQTRTNTIVGLENLNITVRVDNSIPNTGNDNWRLSVQRAIASWNAINNCGIFFVLTANNVADITVRGDGGQLGNRTIASAGFPINGNPFDTVIVNLDFLNNQNVPEDRKHYNMVHELGHCIGFRHTNWRVRGEPASDAILIPGTTEQDANSVMNGGTALNLWNGFSNNDLVASRFLYPYAFRLNSEIIEDGEAQDDPNYTDCNDDPEEKAFFIEIFRDASFTVRANLPTDRNINYQVEKTTRCPGKRTRKRIRNYSRILPAGANRYLLGNVVTEYCFRVDGDPDEDVDEEELDACDVRQSIVSFSLN